MEREGEEWHGDVRSVLVHASQDLGAPTRTGRRAVAVVIPDKTHMEPRVG
jgi:hypothetical protein